MLKIHIHTHSLSITNESNQQWNVNRFIQLSPVSFLYINIFLFCLVCIFVVLKPYKSLSLMSAIIIWRPLCAFSKRWLCDNGFSSVVRPKLWFVLSTSATRLLFIAKSRYILLYLCLCGVPAAEMWRKVVLFYLSYIQIDPSQSHVILNKINDARLVAFRW